MALLIKNIKELVTFRGVAKKGGKKPTERDLSLIKNGALFIKNRKISWVGTERTLPAYLKTVPKGYQTMDAKGMVVLPGLIDPHTHLIFAGSRHQEFLWRAQGQHYLDISKKGGGILSTVKSTRKSSLNELIELGQSRLKKAQSYGITTLEIKSGYGLSYRDELKCLEAVSALQKANRMKLVSTFLGAHAFPPEYEKNKDLYISLLCNKLMPKIAQKKLATFCDVFIDRGFYSLTQTKQVIASALQHHLKIRIHADEFKPLGGTEFAVSAGAHSVDHLIAITKKGIRVLSSSHTVATLLPGTSLFLGKPFAPARKLIDAGVVVALGTDFNPGTCVTQNLPLIATLAITQMKMTIPEALSAITYNAAKSLGLERERGSIEVGKVADLALFDIPSYSYLPYHFGDNFCKKIIVSGKLM